MQKGMLEQMFANLLANLGLQIRERAVFVLLQESWSLPNEKAPKHWKKHDCERVLVEMLLQGILKQKFAYTSYNVNSYMEWGQNANAIVSGSKLFRVNNRYAPTLAGDGCRGPSRLLLILHIIYACVKYSEQFCILGGSCHSIQT